MDESEFEAVYRAHAGAVLRFATRVTGRRDVAEEVTSEAFLALYRHLREIDAGQLPGWLFTVARHRATDYWRHAGVETRYVEHALRSGEGAVAQAPPEGPGLTDLLDAVPELKPVHRACLVLRYVHDFTRDEIAGHVGLSETQVKGLLQYALALVRRRLNEAPK
jgi:RNA polymerase sigma-70 factor (ECF subfamily)